MHNMTIFTFIIFTVHLMLSCIRVSFFVFSSRTVGTISQYTFFLIKRTALTTSIEFVKLVFTFSFSSTGFFDFQTKLLFLKMTVIEYLTRGAQCTVTWGQSSLHGTVSPTPLHL
jgi:hypothetical protein